MIIIMTNNKIGSYGLFVSATIATFIVSTLSWKYIEKPCLKLKKILPKISVRMDVKKEETNV
ncbi:hypothetical protein D3C76_1885570 [compost metagenome]